MSGSAMIPVRPAGNAESLIPKRAQALQYRSSELLHTGPGPAHGTATYLNAGTGEVLVLFVARLRSVGATLAFFDPENEAIAEKCGGIGVTVRTRDIEGTLHVGTPVLVGPLMKDEDGYMDGAAAWSM